MIESLSRYYYNRGLEEARARQIGAAAQNLAKAVSYDSGNIHAWNLAGLCYYRLGKYKTAEYCWTQSLQHHHEGNAAANYKQDVSKNLEEARPYFSQLSTLCEEGKYRQAATVLDQEICSRLGPGADLLNYLGVLLVLDKKINAAVKCWRTVLSMDRNNGAAGPYLAAMENRLSYRLLAWKERLWQRISGQKE